MFSTGSAWLSTTANWWFWHTPYGLRVLLLVVAAAWLALLVHELGHALMARLLGVRVWSISLGRGPLLWQGRIGHSHVRVALFPIHGEVRLYDGDAQNLGYEEAATGGARFEWRKGQSWRAPLITFAGTLGNLLAAKAIVAFWASGPRPRPPILMWTTAVFLVNAFMLLNLMPLRGFDGGRIATHAAAWRRRTRTPALHPARGSAPWPFAYSLRIAAIALQLALTSVFFEGALGLAIVLAALAAEVLSATEYAQVCRQLARPATTSRGQVNADVR
jgi:membrane-associated protease RseP (regulator of RpoE activity)